jgi:hypothetical protein
MIFHKRYIHLFIRKNIKTNYLVFVRMDFINLSPSGEGFADTSLPCLLGVNKLKGEEFSMYYCVIVEMS